MNGILVFGAGAVGIGLFAITVGLSRTVRAAGHRGDILDAITDEAPDLHRAELDRPFVERLLGPAMASFDRAVRAVTPSFWIERVRNNAKLAGFRAWGPDSVFALKAVAAMCGSTIALVLAFVAGDGFVLWMTTGALLGFFVPDVWLAHRATARQEEIRRDLPEALDLLAIAVGAGMGLEQGIELVADRVPGPLGEELHRMLHEVQLGASRRDALMRLRERTDVSELSAFVLALLQADSLGSPLSEVLRVEAVQMRMLRRQRAREYAAKVPVKLLFPLLLCIFPALIVVVIGPAIVSIVSVFGG
ncbi:MAG: type II secretion system F family protein [Actinomycetota bacterium]